MSRFLALAILSLLFLLGCVVKRDLSTRQLKIGEASLVVEVADTLLSRAQGLSGRAELAPDHGMLFVFPAASRYEFWMKDMNFALDFLWLHKGVVVEVVANVPPPSQAEPTPARVRPSQLADSVIEVPAGWAAEHKVVAGAKVEQLK